MKTSYFNLKIKLLSVLCIILLLIIFNSITVSAAVIESSSNISNTNETLYQQVDNKYYKIIITPKRRELLLFERLMTVAHSPYSAATEMSYNKSMTLTVSTTSTTEIEWSINVGVEAKGFAAKLGPTFRNSTYVTNSKSVRSQEKYYQKR